jgi:mono/diheme cytochrome c family protein
VTITGTPSFENGVAHLMALKCAVCHQQPLPDIAPHTTPKDLDLRQFASIGTMRGAQDAIPALRAGVTHQDLVFRFGQARFPQMPPDYGTPLIASERSALDTWATLTAPPDVAGGTTVADGLVLYAAYCQGCHGVGGAGGLAIDVRGSNPANILTAIQIGIASDPDMQVWPGLAMLNASEKMAIANYLASP